jgi:hypothetical protein
MNAILRRARRIYPASPNRKESHPKRVEGFPDDRFIRVEAVIV